MTDLISDYISGYCRDCLRYNAESNTCSVEAFLEPDITSNKFTEKRVDIDHKMIMFCKMNARFLDIDGVYDRINTIINKRDDVIN